MHPQFSSLVILIVFHPGWFCQGDCKSQKTLWIGILLDYHQTPQAAYHTHKYRNTLPPQVNTFVLSLRVAHIRLVVCSLILYWLSRILIISVNSTVKIIRNKLVLIPGLSPQSGFSVVSSFQGSHIHFLSISKQST